MHNHSVKTNSQKHNHQKNMRFFINLPNHKSSLPNQYKLHRYAQVKINNNQIIIQHRSAIVASISQCELFSEIVIVFWVLFTSFTINNYFPNKSATCGFTFSTSIASNIGNSGIVIIPAIRFPGNIIFLSKRCFTAAL